MKRLRRNPDFLRRDPEYKATQATTIWTRTNTAQETPNTHVGSTTLEVEPSQPLSFAFVYAIARSLGPKHTHTQLVSVRLSPHPTHTHHSSFNTLAWAPSGGWLVRM